MHLKLVRSQREGGVVSKTVIFFIDARVQFTKEEQASVARYKLGGQVIYNSEASKRHLNASLRAFDAGTAKGLAKGVLSLAMAALNLNITVDSLVRGHHIECKSLDEMLGAEEALMEACENLRAYLDIAATFDGREVLVEFNGAEKRTVTEVPARTVPALTASEGRRSLPPPDDYYYEGM